IPFSFAAPTLGDSHWVAHFNKAFQNGPGQRVWNNLDVVPHVWNRAQAEQISHLYGNVAPPNMIEKWMIDGTALYTKTQHFVHAHGDGTEWAGSLQKNLTSWKDQLWYQHISAYFDVIGVPPPDWAVSMPGL